MPVMYTFGILVQMLCAIAFGLMGNALVMFVFQLTAMLSFLLLSIWNKQVPSYQG